MTRRNKVGGLGMTNYEKYRDEIVKFNYISNIGASEFCNKFVEPNILKPTGKGCLDIDCVYCRMLMSVWLLDQYKEPKEPEVDWNKVPVDTKIYVKECSYGDWSPRYFAKYENGKVYAWSAGGTSWSCGEDDVTFWEYAVLAEVE